MVEIVLKGLASVSPDEDFTHELYLPASAKPQLGEGALQVVAVNTRLSAPGQPLVYRVCFAPTRAFLRADAELVVHKSSGGRWRFDLQLAAGEPDCDGVITVEAGMDQTGFVPLFLHSSGGSGAPVDFTAEFTAETSLLFGVTPDQGQLLPPRGADGTAAGPLFGPASSAEPDASLGAPLWVSYTCRDFGKVLKGRLLVRGSDGSQYTFDLRGRVRPYVAPKAADMPCSIDHKLAPELTERLSLGRAGPLDYVAKNAKRSLGGWTGRQPS